MSTKMKTALISKAGGDWQLVERDVPEPATGEVRVKVEACGIRGLDPVAGSRSRPIKSRH